jgi:ribosomal protein S21
MSVRVQVRPGEPIRQALLRFKKKVARYGGFWETYRRAWRFAPATQLKRKKRFKKRFKARKATLAAQKAGEQPVASLAEATAAFWKHTGKP